MPVVFLVAGISVGGNLNCGRPTAQVCDLPVDPVRLTLIKTRQSGTAVALIYYRRTIAIRCGGGLYDHRNRIILSRRCDPAYVLASYRSFDHRRRQPQKLPSLACSMGRSETRSPPATGGGISARTSSRKTNRREKSN